MSFRNPLNLDRYEYVSFELATPIPAVGVGQNQSTTGYEFTVDNTSEATPFDWYNAFIEVEFNVSKMDNTGYAAADNVSTVNSIYSFFNRIHTTFGGVTINNPTAVNICCHIKNLLEYSKPYKNITTNEFDYLDETDSRLATIRSDNSVNLAADLSTIDYKRSGFIQRHNRIITNQNVRALVSLNRYGFFGSLEHQICPQGKVIIKIELESSDNLIYRNGGDAGKVVIKRMTLKVPKLYFNTSGQDLFLNTYLAPHEWNYLAERFESYSAAKVTQGTWALSSAVEKPRHVFIWVVNTEKDKNQEHNSFHHDTFKVGGDGTYINSCQLEVGNGNFYPMESFDPYSDMGIAYRMLMSYNTSYNDSLTGSQITLKLFNDLYGIIYFNLRNQPKTLRDGFTKLTFKWKLNQAPAADYNLYAVMLNEQTITIVSQSGKTFIK